MDAVREFLLFLDPALIAAYRIPGPAWLGFVAGTAVLCLACVVIGDLTALGAARLNRRIYGQQLGDMVHHHNLSVRAIGAGDKSAYTAVNTQAHEAFGKYFFSQTAVGMASLWPAPFALAWMDLRFRGLTFPLPWIEWQAHYVGIFILLYILVRVAYGRSVHRTSLYRRLHDAAAHDAGVEEVLSFTDLGRKDTGTGEGHVQDGATPGGDTEHGRK